MSRSHGLFDPISLCFNPFASFCFFADKTKKIKKKSALLLCPKHHTVTTFRAGGSGIRPFSESTTFGALLRLGET